MFYPFSSILHCLEPKTDIKCYNNAIDIESKLNNGHELLGIGTRRLSFIGIGLYVVCLYVHPNTLRFFSQMTKEESPFLSSDTKSIDQIADIISKNDWSLRIIPLRNVNSDHLSESIKRKLMIECNKEGTCETYLQSINKFTSMIPAKSKITMHSIIQFTFKDNKIYIWKDEKYLGKIMNNWISNHFLRIYLNKSQPATKELTFDILDTINKLH